MTMFLATCIASWRLRSTWEGGGGRGRRERGEKREKELINFTHFSSHTRTHLMEDVLAGSPQHDGASFGLPTLHKVCEVFIPNLPHLKETTPSSNVRFFHFICTITYCSPTCPVCGTCMVCVCVCAYVYVKGA